MLKSLTGVELNIVLFIYDALTHWHVNQGAHIRTRYYTQLRCHFAKSPRHSPFNVRAIFVIQFNLFWPDIYSVSRLRHVAWPQRGWLLFYMLQPHTLTYDLQPTTYKLRTTNNDRRAPTPQNRRALPTNTHYAMCSVCIIIKHVHANVDIHMRGPNFASIISYWIYVYGQTDSRCNFHRAHVLTPRDPLGCAAWYIFFIYEFIVRNNAY